MKVTDNSAVWSKLKDLTEFETKFATLNNSDCKGTVVLTEPSPQKGYLQLVRKDYVLTAD